MEEIIIKRKNASFFNFQRKDGVHLEICKRLVVEEKTAKHSSPLGNSEGTG